MECRQYKRGSSEHSAKQAKADLREEETRLWTQKTLHKARVNACDSDTGGVAKLVSEGETKKETEPTSWRRKKKEGIMNCNEMSKK